MRTTIDIPDDLFRKTKATAALRGSTMKELIVEALQREVDPNDHTSKRNRAKLPVMMWKGERKLDLSDFDFDDLLS